MTDPFLNEPVTHESCRCEQDRLAIAALETWGAENASKMSEATCECECKKCVNYRSIHAGIVRRARLELKLAEDGIDMGDLADLLWHRFFAEGLERWIRKRVAEMFRSCLVKLRLRSWVAVTNDSITEIDDE